MMKARGFRHPDAPPEVTLPIPAFPLSIGSNSQVFHIRTDAEELARLLPEPLELELAGEAFLFFSDMTAYSEREPSLALDPERTQFLEMIFSIPCRLGDELGMYGAHEWISTDWAMLMSWLMGTRARLARIATTCLHPLNPRQHSIGQGTELLTQIERLGERVMSLRLCLEKPLSADDLPFSRYLRYYAMRFLPDLSVGSSGRPLVHDLVLEESTGIRLDQLWSGSAEVEFSGERNEELSSLPLLEVLGGYFLSLGFTLRGIRCVHSAL